MFFSLWYFYLVDWSVFGENRFEWNDCFFIFLFVGDSSWCVSGERLSCYNELFSAIALQNYFRNLLMAIYGIIVDLCLISDFKCCSFRCEFCPKFLATNQSAVVCLAPPLSCRLCCPAHVVQVFSFDVEGVVLFVNHFISPKILHDVCSNEQILSSGCLPTCRRLLPTQYGLVIFKFSVTDFILYSFYQEFSLCMTTSN